jgi:hypothetical protein
MSLNQFPRRSFVGSSTLQTFTGDGSTVAYTLSSAQTQNECFVFVDDVAQVPGTDFTVNGTTLTFTSAPANTSEIIVRGFGVPAPITTVNDGAITAAKLATGAIESKLGYTPVSPTQLTTEVNNIIASAPGALNTLDELAAALGDDANYAATITTALSNKANQSTTYTKTEVDTALSAKASTSALDLKVSIDSSTGAATIPVGTTAQRPASPTNGMQRFNTTLGTPEWYSSTYSSWIPFYDAGPYPIEVLIVAGGGGGGTGGGEGGGGGAGGLVYYGAETAKTANGSAQTVVTNTSYSVTIGGGGTGSTDYNSYNGTNGNNSAFGSLITAVGGGKGGCYPGANTGYGTAGGSGGGGGGNSSSGGSTTGGAGTSGQGNRGGNGGYNVGGQYRGGGGGGAGAQGEDPLTVYGSSFRAGNGGVGLAYSISGSSTYYAGGGGAHANGGTNGTGGAGGGGSDGSNATANTGGGGGASSGNGGSGIVILRYLGNQRGSGGSVTSSGGYTIHTFTSSGTYTA